jgi:transcriptional regulator with XRE-family HTH domain
MFDFGERLKTLREKRGLSQAELSKRINKSKSVISGYENNIKTPTLDVLISLAVLYNVSLDYLSGIDKKHTINIDNLTHKQIDIIRALITEFKNYNDVIVKINQKNRH